MLLGVICSTLLGGFVWSGLGTSQLKKYYVKEIISAVTKCTLDRSSLMETERYRAYCDMPCLQLILCVAGKKLFLILN